MARITGLLLRRGRVVVATLLSTLLLWASPSQAHEVYPAIADMTEADGNLRFAMTANLEGFVSGIDLTAVTDTNSAPQAADYDTLRALSPDDMAARFAAFWPDMAARMAITVDGTVITPELESVTIPGDTDPELSRQSVITFFVPLPAGGDTVTFQWDATFGTLVLRQQGVEAPYDGYLEAGVASDPIALSGGGQKGGWATFFDYIPVGFDHIVPKGLDHILFVLGLFFLSTQWRPLLTQVTAFTVAHTITLALASLGWVTVPGSIVEPLIAASITFVAVENIMTRGLSPWRPFVVFGFGLLHGLGFASVLGDFGLPEGTFIPALLGFNVGVELGQLAVIAVAFALVGLWFGGRGWYRRLIAIPASILIGMVGAWWFVERTFH